MTNDNSAWYLLKEDKVEPPLPPKQKDKWWMTPAVALTMAGAICLAASLDWHGLGLIREGPVKHGIDEPGMPVWERVQCEHNEPRSLGWERVQREHLTKEPACVVCGHVSKGLQVHHILDFRLHPNLELVESNLITLCGPEGRCNAHYWLGHCGNYKGYNPHCREDAKLMKARWLESQKLSKE